MVKESFGALCKRVEVSVGLTDPISGSAPSYLAVAHLYFDSVQNFQAAFGPYAQEIMAITQDARREKGTSITSPPTSTQAWI